MWVENNCCSSIFYVFANPEVTRQIHQIKKAFLVHGCCCSISVSDTRSYLCIHAAFVGNFFRLSPRHFNHNFSSSTLYDAKFERLRLIPKHQMILQSEVGPHLHPPFLCGQYILSLTPMRPEVNGHNYAKRLWHAQFWKPLFSGPQAYANIKGVRLLIKGVPRHIKGVALRFVLLAAP